MILSTSEVDALKSLLDWWFVVEYVSTAIVFLGVVGEYIAEFTRFAESRQLVRPLGKLSTLVLIVGLAGELVSLGRTHVISEQLTAFLEGRVAAAEERTKQLEKELAVARVEIEHAKERAAEANEKAEQERLARVKIEEKLARRILSEEQWQKILAKVKPFAGTNFEVRASTNADAMGLLGIIVEVFHRAGWIQYSVPGPIIIPTKYGNAGVVVTSGIWVFVDPRYLETKKPADAFVHALIKEGIDAEVKDEAQEKDPERLRIDIGEKPF